MGLASRQRPQGCQRMLWHSCGTALQPRPLAWSASATALPPVLTGEVPHEGTAAEDRQVVVLCQHILQHKKPHGFAPLFRSCKAQQQLGQEDGQTAQQTQQSCPTISSSPK
jgi:hypothetical protein